MATKAKNNNKNGMTGPELAKHQRMLAEQRAIRRMNEKEERAAKRTDTDPCFKCGVRPNYHPVLGCGEYTGSMYI